MDERHPEAEEPEDFREYREWIENRYNPGHFMGGNLPPYLRPTGTRRRGQKLLGWGLILLGVVTALYAVPASGLAVRAGQVLFGLLQIWVGVTFVRRG